MKHILESQQFTREWLENELFPLAREMERVLVQRGSQLLLGKQMISLFYEPSTRTRASFEIAMHKLGGQVVFSTENAREFSSAAKGETLEDTIRVLNRYCPDVIVLRHNEEGAAQRAAEISQASIINAGDGTGQHPTQALLDVFTIQKLLGRIDGISIAMVGDLANGRTVHSLSYLLGKFKNINIYFVSPDSSKMKEGIKDYLNRHNVRFREVDDLKEVASVSDVIYQTRDQKERGTADRSGAKGFFRVDKEVLGLMPERGIILHPLPRVDEISLEVDKDPRAVYLTDQVDSGFSIRMALLKILLS